MAAKAELSLARAFQRAPNQAEVAQQLFFLYKAMGREEAGRRVVAEYAVAAKPEPKEEVIFLYRAYVMCVLFEKLQDGKVTIKASLAEGLQRMYAQCVAPDDMTEEERTVLRALKR